MRRWPFSADVVYVDVELVFLRNSELITVPCSCELGQEKHHRKINAWALWPWEEVCLDWVLT